MKKIFHFPVKAALLCVCFLTGTIALNAQSAAGTDDDGFIIQIKTPASIAQDIQYSGECGWEGSLFGPSITDSIPQICGEAVWASDSLACSPFAQDLTGKIAIVRRKTCNFSLKVYHCQLAGAKAVFIINHYDAAADGPCTLPLSGMSGGDSAAAITIPSVFLARQTGEQFDAAIAAGETINACFTFPRLSTQTAVYHYATPVSQVDTIGEGIMGVTFINRGPGSGALSNVTVKADIVSPSGNVQSMEVVIPSSVACQQDTISFPEYIPEAVEGKFKVIFSNSAFTEPSDSLYTYFEHTDYTFANDNLVVDPLGVGVSNTDFITGNFIHQSAGLVVTGENGGNATYVTFGIANVDTLWSPLGDDANTIGIIVYDADANNDGFLDIENNFDDVAGQEVGLGSYIMSGNEPVDSLFSVPVYDTNDPTLPVTLLPNHAYYVSLFYDGANAGTGRCLRYSNTLDVPYAINLTTPLAVGTTTGLGFFSGYSGAEVIQRLQMEGFDPLNAKEQKPLDVAKYKITPNPATDVIRLDLKLTDVNKSVTVTLLDWNGRPVRSQTVKEFQNGQLIFNVNDLPSGYYLAWIRTSEGATMAKVAVCH